MRESVNQQLQNIDHTPLMVVVAPMGYGKSTAVRAYLASRDFKVCWQNLYEGTLSSFWLNFCQAFQDIDHSLAAKLAAIGFPADRSALYTILELLGRTNLKHATVLVFDDYHVINVPAVDEFLDLLVREELPNLHIVLISRTRPGLNLTELEIKGLCKVINQAVLVFSPDDIKAYFGLCGVQISNDQLHRVFKYSEGWISIIYLCLLEYLQSGQIETPATVNELIAKTIFQPYGSKIKDFLLTMCIFDSFSEAQSVYMCGDGAYGILEQLFKQNALLKYDSASDSYCLHNLFTGYLRLMLGKEKEERQQEIYKKAGQWFYQNKDAFSAMDFFYKAGCYDDLLLTFARYRGDKDYYRGHLVPADYRDRIMKYFENCPWEVKKRHPMALLVYCICLLSFQEKEMLIKTVGQLKSYLGPDNGDLPDDEEKRCLMGEFALLESFMGFNDIEKMAFFHRKAAALLKNGSSLMNEHVIWTFGSPSVLYLFYRESGQLEREIKLIEKNLDFYCSITHGSGTGADIVMRAEQCYHQGNFDQAEFLAHKAVLTVDAKQQTGIRLCAQFLLSQIALARGNLERARLFLDEMRSVVEKNREYVYLPTLDVSEGYIYSCLDNLDEIPLWLSAGEFKGKSVFSLGGGYDYIVYGKALLLKEEYLQLLGAVEYFTGYFSVYANQLGYIYTYIYQAAACLRLKHREEAAAALRRALSIAAADGLIMPFVVNGRHISPLLRELGKESAISDFTTQILAMSKSFQKATQKHLPASGPKPQSYLTKRENDILQLVAQGKTNLEVASQIYISPETVKKTLQNVYQKFGVNGRAALVKRATELNLL